MRDLILFLAANPSDTDKLALDMECAAIDRELRMVPNGADIGFIAKWAVTADEMMRYLVELQPTVIHFSGHGSGARSTDRSGVARDVLDPSDHAAHRSGIHLQRDGGGSQLVDGRALMKMIKSAAASVRLVVLNACFSEIQAAAVAGVVDCVVGMTGEIDDEAARSFAVGFYRALGNGRSVGNALDQAVAILAAKHPAYEHLPCFRTRDGIDADRVVLRTGARPAAGPAPAPAPEGPAVSPRQWVQRFDAVVNLFQEAIARLTRDPVGAALRARLAMEHIVDFLHERELGPVERTECVDAKLRRLEAGLVLPPMLAAHFASVEIHTSSILHVVRMAMDTEPSFLKPCLGSLTIVVEWFFWDYLNQPAPRLDRGIFDWHVSEELTCPEPPYSLDDTAALPS